jgi:hypothetical protein
MIEFMIPIGTICQFKAVRLKLTEACTECLRAHVYIIYLKYFFALSKEGTIFTLSQN